MKRSTIRRRRGGSAMPVRYVMPHAAMESADAGHPLENGLGNIIRQRIGGGRHRKRSTRTRGGFIPSVMEGFVSATSKYIAPMALFAAYKWINRPTKRHRGSRGSSSRRSRRRS